jgi:hypothetical protein
MGRIFGVLVFIVLLGAAIYVNQPGRLQGPGGGGVTSTEETVSGDGAENPPSNEPPSEVPQGDNVPRIDPGEIPAGFTLGQLSPYFHKVRIAHVSPGSPDDYSQVVIASSFDGAGAIPVRGWLLQGNRSLLYVPYRAVEVYDPLGNAPETDIYLKSGDTLNIYSTVSPIGRNLRLNKCLGYLEKYYDFNPPIYGGCPSVVDTYDLSTFRGDCQDYIYSLGYCAEPDPNPPIAADDYECRAYLSNINYRGCFVKYRGDEDFLSREIRAWTGNTTPNAKFLDFRHDRVLLLDQNGLLVDIYTY